MLMAAAEFDQVCVDLRGKGASLKQSTPLIRERILRLARKPEPL
jgi:hypothetical protein